MVDSIISSTDVSVFGGPSTVNVNVDFGPKGGRGSYIYNVLGIPGTSGVAVPTDLQIFDIAINVDSTSIEYLTMYQYFPDQNGTLQWNRVVTLKDLALTGSARTNHLVNFESGVGTIAISLDGFISETELAFVEFNINLSIQGTKATAHSFDYQVYSDNGIAFLGITITAAERTGSTWAAINNESRMVHLNIAAISENLVYS